MSILNVEVRMNEKKWAKTKVYFFINNESVIKNLVERKQRPYTEYRKMLPKVIEITKSHGIDLEGMKFNWSQYAGCKCPCSPGFVVNEHYNYNVFVNID